MKNQKFIIVKDVDIAHKLMSNGFQLVASSNDMYTFMNEIPQHFNFAEIDIKKLAYTDRLVF